MIESKRGKEILEKVWRYAFFVIAYLLQGLTIALLVGAQSLTVYHFYRQTGQRSTVIGTYIAVLGIVWFFKPLYAWLVSRGGRRRGIHMVWFVLAVGIAALTARLTGTTSISPEELPLIGLVPSFGFLLVVMGHNLASALLDTVADSVVYRTVPKRDRGFVEMLMWASSFLGFAVGSKTIGLYNHPLEFSELLAGFSWVLIVFGLIALLMLGRMSYAKIESFTDDQTVRTRKGWRNVSFIGFLVLVAAMTQVGKGMIEPLFHPWLDVVGGFRRDARGDLLFMAGLMSFAGVFVASLLAKKFSRLVVLALVALGAVYVGFYLTELWWGIHELVISLVLGMAFIEGAVVLLVLLWFRNLAPEVGRTPAFVFQLLMAGLNVGRLISAPIGGYLADRAGFGWTFMQASAMCVLAAVLVLGAITARKLD